MSTARERLRDVLDEYGEVQAIDCVVNCDDLREVLAELEAAEKERDEALTKLHLALQSQLRAEEIATCMWQQRDNARKERDEARAEVARLRGPSTPCAVLEALEKARDRAREQRDSLKAEVARLCEALGTAVGLIRDGWDPIAQVSTVTYKQIVAAPVSIIALAPKETP